MAKYTITIKTLLKNNFNFGLQNYPIFDENYRSTLNNNILNFYYENEIGFETPELFKFYLNNKLSLIMPYYNNLYNAQKEVLNNLLGNVNITEQLKRDVSNDSTSKSNSTNKSVYQDTPQGELVNQDINNFTYATNMNLNGINDTSNVNGNTNETYIKTIIGNNGGKYNIELLNEIKNNLMNIDALIIEELQDLFMGIM